MIAENMTKMQPCKAKQVNNLIYSKYGFRIKANIVSLANCLSIFVTVIGLFALFTL